MGKRTGQLAGLAALGALGYMLSRDKKEAPVESRTASPKAASASEAPVIDRGDDRDIGGGVHPAGFRRNMETGEMYDPGTVPNRTPARASAPVARAAAPAARVEPVASAPEVETGDVPGAAVALARFQEETKGMKPAYGVTNPAALAQGRAPMTKRQPTTQTYKRTGGPSAAELAAYEASRATNYKKGGAVKKMASGGMTTSKASSRADGIAQRGKTRGKIC